MTGRNVGLLSAICLLGVVTGCGLHTDGLPGASGSALTDPSATGGAPGTGGDQGTGGLPGTGGEPGTGGAPATGGVPGTGGVSGTGGTAGTGGVSGTGGTAATGGVSGTGGAGGDVVDGGVDAMPSPPDAGGPSPVTPGAIVCGAVKCDVDQEVCCVGAAGFTYCGRKDVGCPASTATRECDGAEDCSGEDVCCADPEVVAGGYSSSCLKPSECKGAGGAPLCRGPSDCFGTYRSCAPSELSGTPVMTCTR
jgi:hypothetical protein